MGLEEKDLYPAVERYLGKTGLGCFETAKLKGNVDLGIADVIGVKNVGRDRSNSFEVITVEVKKNTKSFGKKVGEALGYSLFAHRCYLAAQGQFTALQKQFAAQLGVGLLEITRKKKCKEILAAAIHQPNEHQMLDLLRRMHLAMCSICCALWRAPGWRLASKAAEALGRRIPLVLHRTQEGSGRLFVCPDCVRTVSAIGSQGDQAVLRLRERLGSKKLRKHFDEIRSCLLTLKGAVEMPTKNRLGYSLGRNFVLLWPKADRLRIKVLLRNKWRAWRIEQPADLVGIKRLMQRAYSQRKAVAKQIV